MSHVWPAVRVMSKASRGFLWGGGRTREQRLGMSDPDEDQYS